MTDTDDLDDASIAWDRIPPTGDPIIIDVDPTDIGHGQAWYWHAAIDQARAGCTSCNRIPCWRHANPSIHLNGFNYSLGAPAFDHTCWSGAAHDDCAGRGGITVQRGGGMTASACEPCALAYLQASR